MDRRLLLVAAVAVGAVGCGAQEYKTAPVTGRVTLDNKPLADATVEFAPVSAGNKNPGPTSVGVTDAEGRYTLTVGDDRKSKGAVVGKHKVIILLTPKQDPTETKRKHYVQLPPRYNRKTELERDVPDKGAEIDFTLTSKP